MIRNFLDSFGKKLQEISLGYVYTGMGVLSASGFILFVNVGEEYSIPELVFNPRTWIAVTIGTVIFLVLGIAIQGLFALLGKFLIFLASWYPSFYYFPKVLFTPKITPENEIELTFTNPKKNREFSLQAAYARLSSKVKPLPGLSMGVAPIDKRLIFPKDDMPGGSERKRVIGKIEKGIVHLVMGKKFEEQMELSLPGTFTKVRHRNAKMAQCGMISAKRYPRRRSCLGLNTRIHRK